MFLASRQPHLNVRPGSCRSFLPSSSVFSPHGAFPVCLGPGHNLIQSSCLEPRTAPVPHPFAPKIQRPIKPPVTYLESTLMQVLIPGRLNSLGINAYKKPRGRPPIIVNRVTVNHKSAKPVPMARYNSPMGIRLIALDIDGTLLDSRWQLPEANRAAIAAATRRGIEVALVTGRRYDFALPIARQIDAPLTMIVSNGAVIRTQDGETHLRHLLAKHTAARVLELTRPWRDCTGVVFDRRRENQVVLESMNSDDPIRTAYYTRNREFLGLACPLESCLTEDPLQVMLSGGVARMREAEAALRGAAFAQDFALAATVYEPRNFSMIDVINPLCSKGAALAEWAALRGVTREEVLAIGDNHNDLEMLAFAGIPVVMGNGVAELKGHGWHETTSNDEGGVAAAIEHFALREAAPCA